jgi:steroid delta-isomerase-like uncharacterized protein
MTTTPSPTPASIVRTWFEEVWNQGMEEAIDRLFARDGLAHGLASPDGMPLRGPDAFRPFFKRFRGAFPDIHIDVAREVTEGDMVSVHCHVTGTHRGNDLGMSATGRPVDFWGMVIARVQGGQIVEAWNSFDFLSLYQQVGLVPQLPA